MNQFTNEMALLHTYTAVYGAGNQRESELEALPKSTLIQLTNAATGKSRTTAPNKAVLVNMLMRREGWIHDQFRGWRQPRRAARATQVVQAEPVAMEC